MIGSPSPTPPFGIVHTDEEPGNEAKKRDCPSDTERLLVTDFCYDDFSEICLALINLYYYMGNFCNLIGLEQWYFSFILKYLHVKITNLSLVVV